MIKFGRQWKIFPLAKVQLCEYENQTLEAFAMASHLYAKFDCPVACQNLSPLATAHDYETGLFNLEHYVLLGFQ